MKSFLSYTIIISLVLFTASCRKKTDVSFEKNQSKMIGKWTIDAIDVKVTDTVGRLLSDTSYNTQGTLEFIQGDQNSTAAYGQGFFNEAHFIGGCFNSELVGYFKLLDAGDAIGSNGWSLFWDADPDGLRIQFWAVTGGGSYHRSLNLVEDATGTQLFYVIDDALSQTRSFYTWHIRK